MIISQWPLSLISLTSGEGQTISVPKITSKEPAYIGENEYKRLIISFECVIGSKKRFPRTFRAIKVGEEILIGWSFVRSFVASGGRIYYLLEKTPVEITP